jgi:thiosulfate/3-mercaptopyruvate sulfurtransferase
MKKTLLMFLFSGIVFASDPFISAALLQDSLGDPKLVLVDVGTKASYFEDGHIPSAVHTDISQWRKQVGQHQVMRPTDELEEVVQKLGINHDSRVVIYGHNEEKELLKASYIAMALIVHGHKDVSILSSGFLNWSTKKQKRPVEFTVPTKKRGNFKAVCDANILVDKDYVITNLKKIPMVEARTPQHYYGVEETKGLSRTGHISGAMSYFWKNSFDAHENIKSFGEIKEIVIGGMGLNPKNETMAYCTGGLEASMNWYVLTQVLKFENVKIYDASLREWANLPDTPMVRYKWETFSR